MRLTVVGCSGSFPGPDSPSSCYLIEADGFRVLLDLGSGALGPLQRHADIYAVDAVLLTHLHADHCLDLCPYYVARKYRPEGAPPPIPVYGPRGTADRIARAYALDPDPGVADVFDVVEWTVGTTQVGPLTVTVDRVAHPGEAYGFRIEHRGSVLAYSGDSDSCPALIGLARDADLFLCEASFVDGRDDGVRDLHLTGRLAAETATAAGARRLLLTHLPPWTPADAVLAEARPHFAGTLDVARADTSYDV